MILKQEFHMTKTARKYVNSQMLLVTKPNYIDMLTKSHQQGV